MKEILRKILAIVLACVLMLANPWKHYTVRASAPGTYCYTLPKDVQEKMAAQEPAIEAYMVLTSLFGMTEYGIPNYPDNYAGEYIDDYNQLVLLVTDRMWFLSSEYGMAVKDIPVIEIQEVDYSYKDLQACRGVVQEVIDKNITVNAFGVDILLNRYYIGIEESDYNDNYDELMLYQDFYPVVFGIENKGYADMALYGGYKITKSNNAGSSIGICGTYNGSNAIITCGHGYSTSDAVFRSGTNIGSVSYQRANQNANIWQTYVTASLGDFSIVTLNSSASITNRVYSSGGTIPITGTYSSVPVNTVVYKYGYATGYSYGSVVATSMSFSYGSPPGYYIDGLYKTLLNYGSIGAGDSGGPVWRVSGSSNLIHGIVDAHSVNTSTGNTYMYSTPIYYAVNIGFSPKLN